MALAIGGVFVLLAGVMSLHIIRIKQAGTWWWFLLINWLMAYVLFTSLGIDTGGYESERYLYTPSFFFCVWIIYSFSLLKIANSLKYLLAGSLIAYHLFFFNIALREFRKAGQLAKDIIEAVNNTPTPGLAQRTVLENLPDKAFGIPLFRLGISNGLKWFHPQYDTSKLIVESKLLNVKNINMNEPVFLSEYDSSTKTLTIKFFPGHKDGY